MRRTPALTWWSSAISPTSAWRSAPIISPLIPAAGRWSIAALIEAGVTYREKARKDVTFEYVLLHGVNDSPEQAAALGKLMGGLKTKLNVIPYNKVRELPYAAPPKEGLDRFVRTVGSFKVFITVRRRRGGEIEAACGQLRAQSGGEKSRRMAPRS